MTTLQTMLRSIAALAEYAQAHPTDSKGIQGRRRARARSEAAWMEDGCPGLEAKTKPLAPSVIHCGDRPTSGDGKDWAPVDVVLHVLGETDKAVKVTDGDKEVWLPWALIRQPGTSAPACIEVDDLLEAVIPKWLAHEKGLA